MIDELRHFLLIVEHGTFTRAARAAHLTQPALTASIQRLEADLDARLFDRGRRGAELTAAGRALVPRARLALRALEDARRAVAEVEGLEAGEVRLAAGATACTYLLPRVLARYRKRYPGIRFLLRETTTDGALAALEAGEIDLAVHTHPDAEPWFDDELVLVGAPDFELPESAGGDPGRAPFVTFVAGSTSRELQERTFPHADVVMELGSIAAVKGNVRAGIGLALVSRHAITRDVRERSLRILAHPSTPVVRSLGLIHLGEQRLPPAARALRALLHSPDGHPVRRRRR